MPWTIVPARLDDATAIAAVVAAAYAPYIARIGTKPGPMLDDYATVIADHIVHVARDGETIGGVVVLIEKPDGTILFDNIAVVEQIGMLRGGVKQRLLGLIRRFKKLAPETHGHNMVAFAV